jgi:hypothetical protein
MVHYLNYFDLILMVFFVNVVEMICFDAVNVNAVDWVTPPRDPSTNQY